jgi:hypothetical protein
MYFYFKKLEIRRKKMLSTGSLLINVENCEKLRKKTTDSTANSYARFIIRKHYGTDFLSEILCLELQNPS